MEKAVVVSAVLTDPFLIDQPTRKFSSSRVEQPNKRATNERRQQCLKETEWDRQAAAREVVRVRDAAGREPVDKKVREAQDERDAVLAACAYALLAMKKHLIHRANHVRHRTALNAEPKWFVNSRKGLRE